MTRTKDTSSLDLNEIGMFIPGDLIRKYFPDWTDQDIDTWLWNMTPWPISWERDDFIERLVEFRRKAEN